MNLLTTLTSLPAAPAATKVSYRKRLQRFWEQLEPESAAILVSSPERTRSNDTEHPYRQSSDIVYLNGFPEPNSVLIVTKFDGKQGIIMLVQPKDRLKEVWTGVREGVEGAKENFFAKDAHPIENFDEVVAKVLSQAEKVYYRFDMNPEFDEKFNKLWKTRQKPLLNPEGILHEMRLFKTEDELKLMRFAATVSAEAHRRAMLECRPGVTENQLQAVLEFVFRAYGATGPAYGSIVASGNNAVILHYTRNNQEIKSGDLVLIDAACEFGAATGGYAADITRTFPANGKFTPAQREVYELVLESQIAAIDKAKSGVPLMDVHEAACKVLRRGLFKMGILPTASAKPPKAKANAKKQALELRDFYMHGTSHWLGLDVHDVGAYDKDNPGDRRGKKRRLLEPGMIITVEPGLYFDANDKRVPAKYRGIGIRIEDDVLITESGNEVLTHLVPKTVEDIEELMA
ncbi:MAG: aminopeptidase P N-terminal domain-containing protein [Candidatus Obscuribacterales bacterium]|nr:aminopeptidase P N-terminal domain-containing protein [Candidatus Obscuribacterales bacterium]